MNNPNLDQVLIRFGDRVYWHPKEDKYYLQDLHDWIPLPEKYLRDHLYQAGFFDNCSFEQTDAKEQSKKNQRAAMNSLFRSFLVHIQKNNRVSWAGELAFYRPGYQKISGVNVLVARGYEELPEQKGDIDRLIENLKDFTSPGAEQFDVLLAFMQHVHVNYKNGTFFFCPALLIGGESGDGKSLFQKQILTGLLGGNGVDASHFLAGSDDKNGEMARAAHLMVDDKTGGRSFDPLRLTEGVKERVANPIFRIRAMYTEAIGIPLPQVVSMVTNINGKSNLMPHFMDEDTRDKFIVIRSGRMNHLWGSVGENNAQIAKAMPAFRYFLAHEYQAPAWAIGDERFIVRAYQHSDLQEEMWQHSTACYVMEIIAEFMRMAGQKEEWIGRPSELLNLMSQNSHTRRALDKHIKHPNQFGTELSRIAKRASSFIQKIGRKEQGTFYKVLMTSQPAERSNIIPIA